MSPMANVRWAMDDLYLVLGGSGSLAKREDRTRGLRRALRAETTPLNWLIVDVMFDDYDVISDCHDSNG